MKTTEMRHTGTSMEVLRRAVGLWPFARGAQRIPLELGRLFHVMNQRGAIGGVGAGNVLFPYQAGDVGHPGYWFLYEKGVRRVLRSLLQPGSIFIDIGAHRGWHSSYALGLVGQSGCVIACEPHPAHAESLRRLASLNTEAKFHVHEVAVSNEAGAGVLLAAEQEGWHTLSPEFNDYCCNVPRKPLQV